MIAALPGLFARKMSGWTPAVLLATRQHRVLVLSGSIVGGLLFGLIALYMLFQIRPKYHG